MPLNSLRWRLAAALLAAASFGAGAAALAVSPALSEWAVGWGADYGLSPTAVALIAAAGLGTAALALALAWPALALAPLHRLTRSLETVTLAYRDGDFGIAMPTAHAAELAELAQRHRALGDALREQRQHLAQRELLLDTVVLNTPVALVLADAQGRIAYANIAARHLLGGGRSLEAAEIGPLLAAMPLALQQAVAAGEDTLLSLELDGQEESLHVSQRGFRLQGRPHVLHLFKHMTRELSRQEVASWKRVIRVISHELNNSLAPISSMAHSGAELLRRGDDERAAAVLASIGQRARNLHGFLGAYADFAKLPTPRPMAVDWRSFVDALAGHAAFGVDGGLPDEPGRFDPSQLEQALINLLKNAHEADGDPAEVMLGVVQTAHEQRIVVSDRGRGMSDAVLAQALLPFYSTKRSGTGLGLALAREIAEAHGGRIALANRDGGGLRVTMSLPRRRDTTPMPAAGTDAAVSASGA